MRSERFWRAQHSSRPVPHFAYEQIGKFEHRQINAQGKFTRVAIDDVRPMSRSSYCFDSVIENSPLRTRPARPSTNFATASSP
jgi:hypothetical protein